MNESETDQIVFPKYFLSETILTTKNGGRGTHFAKFLISPFQWGLTHSALVKFPKQKENIIGQTTPVTYKKLKVTV